MGTAQVLPGILQKHCCILPDRNTESQCTLCGEPEEEEGGDLVQPGISFPGPAEEDLGRVHSSAPVTAQIRHGGHAPGRVALCTSKTGSPPQKRVKQACDFARPNFKNGVRCGEHFK
uniref:disks large-associated protein 2-like isoform X2 n=1 Tax=Panthera onca TaxID=9690 RepID=UPI0029549C2B|nr:disks large-associated protein 2-like isoform X2 [Panthera onca]